MWTIVSSDVGYCLYKDGQLKADLYGFRQDWEEVVEWLNGIDEACPICGSNSVEQRGLLSTPTYRRFLPEDEYVASFEVVPPFLCFQPFVIRDGVQGYMVPCKSDHPEAEREFE